jgi:hypothetical protein
MPWSANIPPGQTPRVASRLACTDRARSVFWLGNGDPIRSAFVTAFLDGMVGND